MFNAVNLLDGDVIKKYNEDPFVWEKGAEVQKFCDYYNNLFGDGKKILQPRKVITDKNWREREKSKFDSGQYILPDFLVPFAKPDHFLHVSSDKKNLAYTKDEIKGAQNVQTKISIGGYLEKYHQYTDRSAVIEVLDQWSLYLLGVDGLKFTSDPKEIEHIYTHYDPHDHQLSTSCMRTSFSHLPAHPTSVYGKFDLALAYLQNKEGKTIARALTYPEKKVYSRVYGNSAIHALLRARGFRKGRYYTNESKDSFVGARIQRIEISKKHFVMPYFDEVGLRAEDKGDHLLLVREDNETRLNTRFAHGTTQNSSNYSCSTCGDEIDMPDVVIVNTRTGVARHWCISCRTSYAFHCSKADAWFEDGSMYPETDESLYRVTLSNGVVWSRWSFDRYGFTCAKTGKKCSLSQKRIVETPEGRQYWCTTAVSKFAWKNALSQTYYSNEIEPVIYQDSSGVKLKVHIETVSNGRFILKDDVYTDVKEPVNVTTVLPQPPSRNNSLKILEIPASGSYQQGMQRAIDQYYTHLIQQGLQAAGVQTTVNYSGSDFSDQFTPHAVQWTTVGRPQEVHGDVTILQASPVEDGTQIYTAIHRTDGSTT